MTTEIPIICNDENAPVAYGTEVVGSLYCGRNLGRVAIPGSDGSCGPGNGPQCESCKRLQGGPRRLEILQLRFPQLPEQALVAALRKEGGRLTNATEYLIRLGAPSIKPEIALPGRHPKGLPEPLRPVERELTDRLLEILTHVDRQTAEVALRRNNNDVERTVSYILEISEDDLETQVVEDVTRSNCFSEALTAFNTNRRLAYMYKKKPNELPKAVLELQNECSELSGAVLETQERLVQAAEDGHSMVPFPYKEKSEDGSSDDQVTFCVVCSKSQSALAGCSYCKNCHLCGGCINSKVVFRCPMMGNGGHLHHHRLTFVPYGLRPHAHCNIGRGGAAELVGCCMTPVMWTCEQCDFDVCRRCVSNDITKGFHRRFGRVDDGREDSELFGDSDSESPSESLASDNDHDTMEIAPTADSPAYPGIDMLAAERGVAAMWEGIQLNNETPPADVLVGTGRVGTTMLAPTPIRFLARTKREKNPALIPCNTMLSAGAKQALELFVSSQKEEAAACDVHHIEDLLRRATNVTDRHVVWPLLDAIATGKVGIAGTLLLAQTYAPDTKRRKTADGEEDNDNLMKCFCGDIIDAESAPDGAIGCLNGHGMHPGCAADQLLGGGLCPTCRDPLFYPKVPSAEAKAAKEITEAELRRRQKQQEEKSKLEVAQSLAYGQEVELNVHDIVRISADKDLCSNEMMKYPGEMGWSSDIAEACGMLGRITEINQFSPSGSNDGGDDWMLAIRVRTQDLGHSYSHWQTKFRCCQCQQDYNSKRTSARSVKCIHCHQCRTCCQKKSEQVCSGYHEYFWTSSLLTLVCRSDASGLWGSSLSEKKLAGAAAAEQYVARLRAELKTVSAARAIVKEELEELQPHVAWHELPRDWWAALRDAEKCISPADWQRACHLLRLANKWGDSSDCLEAKQALLSFVRPGEIDSVARIVRRQSASRVADATKWADAVVKQKEYIVEEFARVDLHAWPCSGAPKTGYSLEPNSRFLSKNECLDDRGRLWIEVDEKSFVDLSAFDGKVKSDPGDRRLTRAILGSSVKRGPDWNIRNHGNLDGGKGGIGIITQVPELGKVTVRWQKNGSTYTYRAGESGKYELMFAAGLAPPPQGWLRVRPTGWGSPAVVRAGRSVLRCFGCGDGLAPTYPGKQSFSNVKKDDALHEGDKLLVAATLEPVRVVSKQNDTVICRFPNDANDSKNCKSVCSVWYRPQDLVYPEAKQGVSLNFDNELVLIDGNLRSRREVMLLVGNETDARKKWDAARRGVGGGNDSSNGDTADDIGCFASCARGHLLHARCFQDALLAGRCCPAPTCTEPLWVPKVRQLQRDDETCCGVNASTEDRTAETELADFSAVARAAEEAGEPLNEQNSISGLGELKMCPACCSGPIFNQDCDDMMSHHGQCSVAAVGGSQCGFRATASDIATRMVEVSSTKTVADVLPQCPTHKVIVMFNGCRACGRLFTDHSWNKLPKWDPDAKALMELDTKKRQAASVLAREVQKEAALLQFERDALQNTWGKGVDKFAASRSILADLPPLPPHVDDFVDPGCGPACNESHSNDGPCLMCGLLWSQHDSGPHICRTGERGSWRRAPEPAHFHDFFEDDDGGDY